MDAAFQSRRHAGSALTKVEKVLGQGGATWVGCAPGICLCQGQHMGQQPGHFRSPEAC